VRFPARRCYIFKGSGVYIKDKKTLNGRLIFLKMAERC